MSNRIDGAPATADLHRVADLAARAGLPSLATEAERTAERIADGRFYVACVGQFKRGKSTLLNALIGEPILPTGVVPVTSVVTVLRYGAERGARIRLARADWQPIPIGALAAYVSEEQNPENEKGIEAVEVFVPAKLLDSGLCLVDTPGIGSVFSSGTEATRAFVPHIDAALIVLGADPPISGDEVALLEVVAERVQTLIFVLSKADRLSESDRMEAARFAQRVIEQRLRRSAGPILQVSGLERLSGGRT
jgi:putative ribosome biogenesis GTPase RsgA